MIAEDRRSIPTEETKNLDTPDIALQFIRNSTAVEPVCCWQEKNMELHTDTVGIGMQFRSTKQRGKKV